MVLIVDSAWFYRRSVTSPIGGAWCSANTSDEDVRGDGDPVFRIAPIAMAEVEVNFLLANVDFEDYAGNVDDDGVFRGFDR